MSTTLRKYLMPFRIIFFAFISLSLIAACLIVGGTVILVSSIGRVSQLENLCNVENEVYQAIQANTEKWIEDFPPAYPSPAGSLRLDQLLFTRNGRRYYMRVDYWLTGSGDPIFYVQTADGWPATPLGIRGLFYTPTNALPVNGIDEITYLSDNIYCYRVFDS